MAVNGRTRQSIGSWHKAEHVFFSRLLVRLSGVWSRGSHAVWLHLDVVCLMVLVVLVLVDFGVFEFDLVTMVELAILSPGFLVLACLFLLFFLSFQGGATLISHDQELDPLCQDAPCNLAILTPRASLLTFYDEASGQVFQLYCRRSFVDFLTAGTSAFEEGFCDIALEDGGSWWKWILRKRSCGGEEGTGRKWTGGLYGSRREEQAT